MILGGILLALGTILLLISWFEIRSYALSFVLEIYIVGFFVLMTGLILVFMRNIAKNQQR